VEEDLETAFRHGENNVDKEAMNQILNYPNAFIGLSDGGLRASLIVMGCAGT